MKGEEGKGRRRREEGRGTGSSITCYVHSRGLTFVLSVAMKVPFVTVEPLGHKDTLVNQDT